MTETSTVAQPTDTQLFNHRRQLRAALAAAPPETWNDAETDAVARAVESVVLSRQTGEVLR